MAPIPKRDRWTLILIVVIVAMGVEILYLLHQNQKLTAIIEDPKRYFATLTADDIVPSFTATDIRGQEVSLRYSPTAPHSVLFWFAPTCSSCEDNIEFWNHIYTDYNSENVRCLGLCVGKTGEAGEYVAQHEIQFPVVCTDEAFIVERYRGNVLPQTVIVSPEGRIVEVWPGALGQSNKEKVIALLAKL